MITAKDFTKAEEGIMPAEPGLYICLLRAATGEAFFAHATYSQKSQLFSLYISVRGNHEIVGWMQIDEPVNIAKQLTQK